MNKHVCPGCGQGTFLEYDPVLELTIRKCLSCPWSRVATMNETATITTPLIPEKAKTDKVGTGLLLIPFYSLLRIGAIFIEGLRYGKDNWKKGANDKEYQEERLEHVMLHLIKWKEGDRSEDHLAKVSWFCLTQMELERLEKE